MTDQQRKDLCKALLLFRYLGHKPAMTGRGRTSTGALEKNLKMAERVLNLARTLGISREYLELALKHHILTVTCTDLEEMNKRPQKIPREST